MGGMKGEEETPAAVAVRVIRKEVVAAALPVQEHWLPFSNLDLLLPPVDVGLFFCYKKPTAASGNNSTVGVLKKALGEVLVTYYPFAGEVVGNSLGEPELLCNNRGVDFIEAVSEHELQQLDYYNPDSSFEAALVPHKKEGVLTVQVTELKCGGLVVGCTFDHRVADAFSTNMFLVSWAEMARSQPSLSTVPSFRRSLLNPRRPLSTDPCFHAMYMPVSSLPPPPKQSDQLSSRIYYLPADQLNHLQSLANHNHNMTDKTRRTKLESFSALLWKMIAQYQHDQNKKDGAEDLTVARMGVVVDGRSGLSANEPLMGSYFGNVLSIPYGDKTVEELEEKPLGWVADQVHSFLRGAVTKEHFLGLIDWVEGRRPEPACTRVYGTTVEEGAAFVVSSGLRFPESKVDFGWGRPVLGSYHFPWGGQAGYVMPMPSPLHNGDWIVYMHLFQHHLDFVEARAPHMFKPLTWDYLSKSDVSPASSVSTTLI